MPVVAVAERFLEHVREVDALTKHVDAQTLRYHLEHTGQTIGAGRHSLAPSITAFWCVQYNM